MNEKKNNSAEKFVLDPEWFVLISSALNTTDMMLTASQWNEPMQWAALSS